MAKINPFATAPHSLQEWLLGMYAPAAEWPSGSTWYVHTGDGTNEAYDAGGSERGLSPGKPFASLAYAVADPAVVASRNTHIVLLPGHVEEIAGAAGVNLNKIGIRVIGEGFGSNKPIIDFTTDAAASFDVNSASCSIKNVIFRNSINAQTAMVNVKAADFTIEDCEFRIADSSTQATLGVLTTAAADRMRIINCDIHGTNNAGCTNAIRIVGTTDVRIDRCKIIGSFSDTGGAISVQTTAAVHLMIDDCVINNRTTGSTKVFVDAITGTTGVISHSEFGILSGSAPLTCATMHRMRNWYSAAVDNSGAIY